MITQFALKQSIIPHIICMFVIVILPLKSYGEELDPPQKVIVQVVKDNPLTITSEFSGKVEAFEKVDIVARISGILGPRLFEEGQYVKSGQVIFEIDPAQYQIILNRQKAAAQSYAAILANAKLQLERTKFLAANNAIAKGELDRMLAEEKQAEAKVLEGQTNIEDAELQLSYTKLLSPIDGRIGRAKFTPGNLVTPNSGSLATIVSDKLVRILFPVTHKEILEANGYQEKRKEMKINIKLANGVIIKDLGKVDFVDVSADQRTDTIMVRATVNNSDGSLVDGEIIHVLLDRSSQDHALFIPHKSIAYDQTGPYCMVVDENKKAVERRVILGTKKGDLIQVTQGLKIGDKVIVSGIYRLEAGTSVVIQEITNE